ncbi:helix-turn-helix transcriptional regulator [Azohydromonas australica]|uniref:helix-turn-helix transcriptional regulator n=1 Tax=Azohydromonas australica TaxID=364039 RepID=UPI002873B152|nr:response regulator transcription factor [Azohydromonas australica]
MVEALQQHSQAQSEVVSVHDDEHLSLALQASAYGHILKEQPRKFITAQLQRISQDESPLPPSIARRVLAYFAAQAKPNMNLMLPHIKLTERESCVLLRVAKGFTLPGIGVQLQLSRHTIADYVKQIYRKLNVRSHLEAALKAQRLGLFNRANSMNTSYSGLANWQR